VARLARDRLELTAEMANWAGSGSGSPFQAGRLLLRWESSEIRRGGWLAGLGVAGASPGAPLALWPGAGTGHARTPLLRAHPLLDGGVLDGPAFGRRLIHVGIERQGRPRSVGPVRLGWAVFVDGAKPWDTLGPNGVPWLVDGGWGCAWAAWAAGVNCGWTWPGASWMGSRRCRWPGEFAESSVADRGVTVRPPPLA